MVHWSWARVSMRAILRGTWLVAALGAGCGPTSGQNDAVGGSDRANGSQRTDPPTPEVPRGSGDPGAAFPADLPRTAEMHWLTTIGWGPAQTDRVCARGNQDPVARRLCAEPRVGLRSL